jgi:outer membrane protein OmpA-like peptidoglycan-associated protein
MPAFSVRAGDTEIFSGSVTAAFDTVAGGRLTEADIAGHQQSFTIAIPDGATAVTLRMTNDATSPDDGDWHRNIYIVAAQLDGVPLPQSAMSRTLADEPAPLELKFDLVALFRNADAIVLPIAGGTGAPQPACDQPDLHIPGFAINSARLPAAAAAQLAALAETLTEACRLTIVGYSSSSGPQAVNDRLSEARGKAVFDYLAGRAGGRLQAIIKAGGATAAFGTGTDNQRVVILIDRRRAAE